MWEGEKEIWGRHAPVLFPIVGKLKNNSYRYNGKECKMPQHGFARDCDFKLVSANETSAAFELCASEKTFEIFPFHFLLGINYSLSENILKTTYKVSNPSNENLFFSLGTHPGFSCNIGNANGLENFFLEFEKEENTVRNFVKDGLISEQTEKFSTTNKKYPLSKNTFEKDAVVLKKTNSSSVKLLNNKNAHGRELKWGKDFSYFGIWNKPGCEKFVCLEPWAGIADGINFSGNFNEKEGIIQLKPSEQKEFELEMKFF